MSYKLNVMTGELDLVAAPPSGFAPDDASYVVIGPDATLSAERVLTGTTNQITITDNATTVVISVPQDIHTGATPTFSDLVLSSFNSGAVIYAGTGGALSHDVAGLNFNGSTNRLGINESSPATYVHASGTHVNNIGLLQVDGTSVTHAYISMNASSARNCGFLFLEEDTVKFWYDYVGGSNYFRLYNPGVVATAFIVEDSTNYMGINNETPGGRLHIESGATTEVVLIVQAIASQTENLQEWQNSAGSSLTTIRSDGRIHSTTLTASRLMATDGTTHAVSSDLNSWVTGTSNRVTVTDDGDGTITLNGPQDLHTGATPTFSDLILSSFTEGSVVLVGSGGAINEDNSGLFFAVSTNRLGVNETSPATLIHASGTHVNNVGLLQVDGTAVTHAYISMNASDAKNCGFLFLEEDTVKFWYDYVGPSDYFRLYNPALAATAFIVQDADNHFGVNNDAPAGRFHVKSGATGEAVVIIQGIASQTSPLLQLLDSSDGIFFTSGDGLASSEVVWNDQQVDIDFRIEGETLADLFKTDAGKDQVELNGGLVLQTTRVTTTYTILALDNIVLGNTDSAGFTATLPAGAQGLTYKIVNSGSSANDLTLAPDGSDHLLGVNSNFVLSDGESLWITFDATDGWY